MAWKLFIDDERAPLYDFVDAVQAFDVPQAIQLIEARGLPEAISFDHDLGATAAGPKDPSTVFMRYLIDQHLDGVLDLTTVKQVVVHTNNVVGGPALISLWDSFISFCGAGCRAEYRPRKGLNE